MTSEPSPTPDRWQTEFLALTLVCACLYLLAAAD